MSKDKENLIGFALDQGKKDVEQRKQDIFGSNTENKTKASQDKKEEQQ